MLDVARNLKTDRISREALQLAVQLPDSVAEARAVLDRTSDILEGYMIRAPHVPITRCRLPERPRDRLLVTMLSVFCMLAPIAVIGSLTFGHEIIGGFVMLLGVCYCSLELGELYGVTFSLMASVCHNFFVVAPIFEFSTPTDDEVIRLIGFVVVALALPAIASGRLRPSALTAETSRS